MDADKTTPRAGEPGGAVRTKRKQAALIFGPSGGVAETAAPHTVPESLTAQQCAAMRSAASRFGYVLTWAVQPRRGLTWYVTPAGGRTVVLGATAEVHRFLANHIRWASTPGLGPAKMRRWHEIKVRSATRRAWWPSQNVPHHAGQAQ